jgi:hypothetical protein
VGAEKKEEERGENTGPVMKVMKMMKREEYTVNGEVVAF